MSFRQLVRNLRKMNEMKQFPHEHEPVCINEKISCRICGKEICWMEGEPICNDCKG